MYVPTPPQQNPLRTRSSRASGVSGAGEPSTARAAGSSCTCVRPSVGCTRPWMKSASATLVTSTSSGE